MFCPPPARGVGGRVGSDGCREGRPRKRAQGQEKEAGRQASGQTRQARRAPPPHPKIALEQPWASQRPEDSGCQGRRGNRVVKVCIVIVRMPPLDKAGQGGHLSPGPESNLSPPPPPPPARTQRKNQNGFQPPCQDARAPTPTPTSVLTLRKAKGAPSRPHAYIYKLPFPSPAPSPTAEAC